MKLCSCYVFVFFFFNDTATTEIYTLSLHDALPIYATRTSCSSRATTGIDAAPTVSPVSGRPNGRRAPFTNCASHPTIRSEEHTSELQSQSNLVCRLLLEKKKKKEKIPKTELIVI